MTVRRVILVVALIISVLVPVERVGGVAGFGDVAADRFFTKPVQWMVDNDITTGTSATCFSPDDFVTRGQAAAFMWRMEGEPAPSVIFSFIDVVKSWQLAPVSWMFEKGITTGTAPNLYSPDDFLTRGQLAALLWRLAGNPAGSPPHPFLDVVKDWQQAAVSWMFFLGITTGTSATMFSPDDPVTRGQLAAFFYRYKGSPAALVDPRHPTSPPCEDQVAGPPTTTTTTTTPTTTTTTTTPTTTTTTKTDPPARAPTGLTATQDGTSANLSWTAPADDGGSAITDYVVEYRQMPDTTVTVDADAGDTSMTALGGTTGRYQWEELIVQAYDFDDVAAPAIISTVWNDNGVGVNGGRWDTQIDWSYEVNAPTGASETLDIIMPYPSTAITIWSAMMDPGEGDNPGSFTGGDGDETGYATCYDVDDNVVGEMRLHPSTADGPNEGTGRYPFIPILTGPCSRIRVEALPWQNAAGDVYADEDDGQTYDNEPTIVLNNTDLMVGAVEWNPTGAGGAGGWSTLADGTSAATSAVVPGLTAGLAYEFRVSVTNSVGTGAVSSSAYLLLNVDVAIIPATSSTTSDTAAVTATAEITVTAATYSTSSV